MEGSVKLSDDETIIKDYYAANIKKPSKGEAHVILTNKRVMINYQTKNSILVNDLHIKEVRGADVSWSTGQKRKEGVVLLIIGIAIFISGILISFQGNRSGPEFLIFLGIGVPMIVIGIYSIVKTKTTFIMLIHSKSITESLAIHNLSTNLFERRLEQSGLNLKFSATPGPDAQVMAGEIGVVILDIQKKAKLETEVL